MSDISTIPRAIRSWMIGWFYHRIVGVPAALFFHLLGANEICRKISMMCGYTPSIVHVDIGNDETRTSSFSMYSAGGLEQVSRSVWWAGWRSFERPLPELFSAWCGQSRRVLDIGSYSGFYSMIAVSFPNVEKCYAFEPLPEMHSILERNIHLNRLHHRIEVVPAAVSERPGVADFYIPTATTQLLESSSSLNPRFHKEHLRTIQVPMITLDQFLDEKGFHPVDLMKIDVETHEHSVLIGARRVLSEDRPVIFVEILRLAECDTLEAICREFSYRCGVLLPYGVKWEDRVQFVDQSNDHCFCPIEKVDQFNKLVESIGFRVERSV